MPPLRLDQQSGDVSTVLYVLCEIVKNLLNAIQLCAHLFEQAKEARENPGTPSGLDDHPPEYPGDPGSYPETPRTPTERTPRTPTENSNGEDPLNSSSGIKTGHNLTIFLGSPHKQF